jgi:AAA domain
MGKRSPARPSPSYSLPFVHGLDLDLDRPVTFFVGENGTGKSTLLEAIADLCGFGAGGGGRDDAIDARAAEGPSALSRALRPRFRHRPRDGFFFRAERHRRRSLADQSRSSTARRTAVSRRRMASRKRRVRSRNASGWRCGRGRWSTRTPASRRATRSPRGRGRSTAGAGASSASSRRDWSSAWRSGGRAGMAGAFEVKRRASISPGGRFGANREAENEKSDAGGGGGPVLTEPTAPPRAWCASPRCRCGLLRARCRCRPGAVSEPAVAM